MSAVPCLIAIDPGASGAIAFYFPTHDRLAVEDMPMAGGKVDAPTLAARIIQFGPTCAILEDVTAQGTAWSAKTAFTFGHNCGVVQGVIAARCIPLHMVRPQLWKRHFRLPRDKEQSRALALRLWPDRADLFGRKRDEGRSEAALLARYAAEVLRLGVLEVAA